mgnify:CR=1 FL=1
MIFSGWFDTNYIFNEFMRQSNGSSIWGMTHLAIITSYLERFLFRRKHNFQTKITRIKFSQMEYFFGDHSFRILVWQSKFSYLSGHPNSLIWPRIVVFSHYQLFWSGFYSEEDIKFQHEGNTCKFFPNRIFFRSFILHYFSSENLKLVSSLKLGLTSLKSFKCSANSPVQIER